MKITLLEQNHSSFFVFPVSFGFAEAPFFSASLASAEAFLFVSP
jgi:hypothetical protein